ncbi:metallophosphoesterase [Brevibacillus ruminantium]|uniref:Metallophosphoesterase n=1 Tax=Brevibacillus ruminantium TaxID=2950604 RepID=A0ABY4WC80_9BACL|nr:metallophosphoesterase [Brevibacillus ruminantium]USG64509.1 metallophosphoesterase [Brevibacillus ruminantium]
MLSRTNKGATKQGGNQKGMIGFALFFGLIVLVSLVIETCYVRCSHYRIRSPFKKPLKIVQLSDIHGRTRFLNGSISRMANLLRPDIVIITGDLTTSLKQTTRVLEELQKIQCKQIVFVPGNYERETKTGFQKRLYNVDEYHALLTNLREQDITVLENSFLTIPVDGQQLFLYGFDNSIYGNERLNATSADWEESVFLIALAHSPNIIHFLAEHNFPYDLLLTGHTHGGQIRFFGRTFGEYKHFHTGLKVMEENRHFYIHRGLGTVKLPVRIACPPEIAVFHLNE